MQADIAAIFVVRNPKIVKKLGFFDPQEFDFLLQIVN